MSQTEIPELQRLWLAVQSERNPDTQSKLLCESMFPLFSKLCTSSGSFAYRSTFADGRALASVVCRIYSRVADPTAGVNETLSSQRYAVLLSYLSTLLEPEYHRANIENESISRIEAMLSEIRVDILRHDILKIMLNLHNIFLDVVSGLGGALSDSAVAAEQTHLAIFKCLLESADARVLSEAVTLRVFQSICSTITICYLSPFRGSSSLSRMACDVVETVLNNEGISMVIAPEAVQLAEEDIIFRRLLDDVRRTDDHMDAAIRAQKLNTLSHCVHAIHLLRAASHATTPIRFDLLITCFLSLQNVMPLQKSLVEGMFEDYMRFAFISVTVAAPKKKEKSGGVFGLKKKLVSMVFTKEEAHVEEVRFVPECLRKAVDFINRSTFKEPRLWFASRLCECMMKVCKGDGPDAHTVATVLYEMCQQAPAYDAELLKKVLGTLDFIATKAVGIDVTSSLTTLSACLTAMEPIKQDLVVRFFSTLVGSSDAKLLAAVGESSIVVATCGVIDKMSAAVGSLDESTIEVCDAIFCLWKVLLMTDDFINDFNNGMALPNLIKCTLAPTDSPINIKFVVSSRNALVSLVQQRKDNVSALLDAILGRATTGRGWTVETTRHVVNLAVTIYGAHCHEETIAHNGITILLSLLKDVVGSPNYAFDLHVIAFIMSMLLPHVRWSDAPAMLVNSLPKSMVNTPEAVRFAIVVACGIGVQSEILSNMLDTCYSNLGDPSEEAVRFIDESTIQTKLCEMEPIILMLCEWYTVAPSELVRNAISMLVDAHRTPIADPIFCNLVVANNWAELMPFMADFTPLQSSRDGALSVGDCIEQWYSTTRKVPSRHAITFLGKGNGGTMGRVQLPTPSWPPINGLSVAGTFMCSADGMRNGFGVQPSSNQSTCIPLWRLRWDYGPETDSSLYLMLDTAQQMLVLSRGMSRVETVAIPADITDQWVHICVVMHRWQNDVTVYINGNPVLKQGLDYPVVIREGGVLATNRLDVNVGFPQAAPGRKQPAFLQSLSLIGFQIYEGPLLPEHVHNLVAAAFHVRDPTVLIASNASSISLTAPVLSNPYLRKLNCTDLNTAVRQLASGGTGFVRVRVPDVPAVVSFHPSVTTLNPSRWEALGNKAYVMPNMSTTPCSFKLYGRYSKPPTTSGSPIGYFLAHEGPSKWLKWLQEADALSVQQVAMLLDMIGDCVMEGLELSELVERDHFYKLAAIISNRAQFFTQPMLLPCLIRLAIRSPSRHAVIVNGPLMEMLFCNWAFLSNLQYDAAFTILADISHAMNVNSPYAKLNAWRLRKMGFIDGFICGLARHYVAPQVMGEALNVIDRFLHSLLWDHTVISEVVTFIAASVPRSSDYGAHFAKLASPLPPCFLSHLDAARNITLNALFKCIVTAANASHDVSGAIPVAWFPMITSTYSHPVSVSLAMSIFAVLYTTSSNFRNRCAKQHTLRALQGSLVEHAHQSDLLSILGELIVNNVRDVLVSSRPLEVSSTRGQGAHVALIPLFMELVKRCGLTLRPTATNTPNVPAQTYFLMFKDTPISRLRTVFVSVLSIVRLSRLARNGVSVSSPVRKPVQSPNQAVDSLRRADLVTNALSFVARLIQDHESVAKLFFNREGTVLPLEAVAWSVIASTDVVDPTVGPCASSGEVVSSTGSDKATHSASVSSALDSPSESDDSDFEALSLSMRGVGGGYAMEKTLLDRPKYPDLLAAALSVYTALLKQHISQFETFTSNTFSLKTSELVFWLHTILCSSPPGIGDRARGWFQVMVIDAWLNRAAELIRSQADDASGTANKTRNGSFLGLYVVERLVAGQAVPPKTLLSFLIFLMGFTSNSEVIKSCRLAILDFTLYTISEQYHSNNPDRISSSLMAFYEYKDQIFKAPFPSNDMTKLFTRRLLEVTLSVNHKRSDEDPEVMTNEEKCLVDLWQQLMMVNKGSPVFPLIFTDGGPGTGRYRTDLFQNGFDKAASLVSEKEKTDFIMWLFVNDARIREMIHTNPNAAADQKYATCVPKRAIGWSQRSEDEIDAERNSFRSKIHEAEKAAEALWVRNGFNGSSVDPSLLDVSSGLKFALKPFIAWSPPTVADESPVYVQLGGVASSAPTEDGHLHLLQNGATPLGSIMSHAGDGCITLSMAESVEGSSGGSALLKPSAQRIIDRVLEGCYPEARGAPILWVGNVYHVVGNESIICILLITSYEVVIISSSQLASDGNIYISSLETHEANKASQKKGAMVRNVIRRFIPKAPIPASLSSASLATFRHSQYFRQLRTEAKAIQRDSRVWRFPLATLSMAHHRHFQHEAAAAEFVLEDGSRHFVVFLDNDLVMSRDARQTVMDIIADQAGHVIIDSNTAKRARVVSAQKKWSRRQLSNYDYLMAVNDAASRTFADLTQYPVMPWVLASYTDMFVDLDHARYYRDLSKPLGALDDTRRKEVTARYLEWLDDTTPPFHYGTHYSTSAIVMYFLVRLEPLTSFATAYQGGRLDVADRLFHSIEEAWKSCSSASGRDVKELIPEFFSLQQFLVNRNRIDLGTRRDGVSLNDVQLPYWATSTAAFIHTNREALESDTVSTSLNHWIDLIFGYKQEGDEAVAACNVFHHLTYAQGFEEAMTSAASEEDRKAIVASVDNFGLTPKNVFKTSHPKRNVFHPIRSHQEYFQQNMTQLQIKPAVGQLCDVHCTGQPIYSMVEHDGVLLTSTFNRRTTSVKPLQHFVIDVTRSLIVNYRTKDQCTTVLPDISTFGLGSIACFDCSPTGNMVFVGTSLGSVVVLTRQSWTSRHTIAHVLHNSSRQSACTCSGVAGRGSITALTYLGAGRLAVATGRLLTMWHIGRRGATHQWSCDVYREAIGDDSAVKSVALTGDAVDAVVAVKDKSIYVIVGGEIMTSTHISVSAPGASIFMTASYMCFPSYSPVGIFCCGHSDGRLTFWNLTSNFKPKGTSASSRGDPYLIKYLSTRQVDVQGDGSAITAITPQPTNLSLVVGCKSGAMWSIAFPQSVMDAFNAEI